MNLRSSFFQCIVFLLFTEVRELYSQNDSLRTAAAFTCETSYIGDVVHNCRGGIEEGTRYLGMANIKVGFNFEKAGLYKGGDFFINAANTHGGTPSADLFGDFQGISNIEAGNLTYIQEFWYKQSMQKATIIVGLQDLNAEFISSEFASVFLNSSFGTHSNIAENLPVPIFPLTSLGLQIHYTFSERLTIKTAIFDGVPEGFESNPYNLSWDLKKEDGFLWFTEISGTRIFRLSGSYKLGGYFHNSHKTTITTENQTTIQTNPANYGVYFVFDQPIIKTNSGKELSLFAKGSISPRSINDNCYYYDLGIHFKEPFTGRDADVAGIAFAHAGIHRPIGSETAIELSYKAQLGEHLFIQPDVQYIINPAGSDIRLANAFGAIVRFGVSF
jgi:porin